MEEGFSRARAEPKRSQKGDATVGLPEHFGPPTKLHLKNRNVCNIICNKFDDHKENLSGYEIDTKGISSTFSWLNFEINLLKERNADEMEADIHEMSKADYSDKDCFVLFLLSHGDSERNILGADGRPIKIDSLIDKICTTKSLRAIPKLFFIQTCRGDLIMEAIPIPESNAVAAGPKRKKAEKADTLIFYSTTQGYSSWVGSKHGSFFVTVLCRVLQEYCVDESLHLGDVITKVNDVLSTYYSRMKWGKTIIQVSEVQHTLTSHLYFYPQGTYAEFMLDYKEPYT